jgi:hypothetical protein
MMNDKLLERPLSALEAAVDSWNKSQRPVDERIRTTESRISEMGIDLPCWLEKEAEWLRLGPDDSSYELGWDYADGAWCIAVRKVGWIPVGSLRNLRSVIERDRPEPLLSAPRWVRIAAAAKLEGLLRVLTRAVVHRP